MAKQSVVAASQLNYPNILDPHVFRTIEKLCQDAIAYSDNHSAIRSSVIAVVNQLSKLGEKDHGHRTVEVVTLQRLLKRTHPKVEQQHDRPRLRLDPLNLLLITNKLTTQQGAAAQDIQSVWDAFGKFLTTGSRNYSSSGGGKKGRVLSPMDVMGEPTYKFWRDYYSPWYEKVKRHTVVDERLTKVQSPSKEVKYRVDSVEIPVSVFSVVYDVLIEAHHPYEIDNALCAKFRGKWKRGLALKVLRQQLDNLIHTRKA